MGEDGQSLGGTGYDWRNCLTGVVTGLGKGGAGRQEQYLINQGVIQNKTMAGGSLNSAPFRS